MWIWFVRPTKNTSGIRPHRLFLARVATKKWAKNTQKPWPKRTSRNQFFVDPVDGDSIESPRRGKAQQARWTRDHPLNFSLILNPSVGFWWIFWGKLFHHFFVLQNTLPEGLTEHRTGKFMVERRMGLPFGARHILRGENFSFRVCITKAQSLRIPSKCSSRMPVIVTTTMTIPFWGSTPAYLHFWI